jgi:hypothetical protein
MAFFLLVDSGSTPAAWYQSKLRAKGSDCGTAPIQERRFLKI